MRCQVCGKNELKAKKEKKTGACSSCEKDLNSKQ